jgi:predicted enzyme related to lactoylglutathione lyase
MHSDLVSKDPAATQKFLETAFALKFDELGAQMGNYRIYLGQKNSKPGEAAGDIGIRAPNGPEHPGTVSFLAVASIDDAIKDVKAAGAKIILEKTEIPNVGHMAVFVAPGEVALGLFQTKPH